MAYSAPSVQGDYSMATSDDLAWDLNGIPERGPSFQPWRAYWPPSPTQVFSDEEKQAKPWLTWKRDATVLNDKPWYQWVNLFEGEVDEPCLGRGKGDPNCPHCQGSGCNVCSTVAEGG
ncbi:hypothetical protein CMQ_2939 [Grosmannia clavigera kw1407]|uniref:Uncharacterized protein n=1 Tax=Grosmannia clavigera (strain kw1407 / UAMH 11150) TaxID=655863 RepID=F0XH76_GROCL|nr:uncharacterized protein CMQ_2939 [Grosmannia clavigera kw1407]EFX03010.1 hypothetical protein CMQ_2939 [Grosmannia clavigera kw1407]